MRWEKNEERLFYGLVEALSAPNQAKRRLKIMFKRKAEIRENRTLHEDQQHR